MESFINTLLNNAKATKDLKMIAGLYNGYKDNLIIKFEYAKMLTFYGKYAEAEQIYKELLGTRNSDYAMLELGRSCRYAGDIDKAREYFEILTKKGDKAGMFELARLEGQYGKVERAKKLFGDIKGDKLTGYAKVEIGKLEEGQGHIDKAREIFKDVISTHKLASAKLALGKLERDVGNIDAARGQFESIFKNYKDLAGKYELGRLELFLGNYEKAKEIFLDLQKNYNQLAAYIELGRLEYVKGNLKEAKECFLKLEDTKIERFGYYLLVALYLKENDYEETFRYIKQAMDHGHWINPDIVCLISKELNIFFPQIDYQKYSINYTVDQVLNYDVSKALKHVKKRHINLNNSDFKEGVDLDSLIVEVKDLLDDNCKVKKLGFNDVYIIPYPNIGKFGEEHVKVVTLPNTKDIITMYPTFKTYDSYKEDISLEDFEEDYIRNRKR